MKKSIKPFQNSIAGLLSTGLLLVMMSPASHATTVYKKKDSEGNWIFTDENVSGSQAVKVEELSTVPAIPKNVPINNTATKTAVSKYESISMSSPANDQSFTNPQGPISISATVTPGMNKRHKIQLIVNGAAVGEPQSSPSWSYTAENRGSYNVSFNIVDAQGKTMFQGQGGVFHVIKPTAKRPANLPTSN